MPKHVLGIDLGPEQMTFVRLSGTSKAFSITDAIHYPLPRHPDAAEQDALRRQGLQELVDTHRLRTADTVLLALPAHKGVLRNISLPFKDPRRIRQALKGALEEHMPLDPEDVVVDFQLLPTSRTTAASLLVGALPHDLIAVQLGLLQEVGLEPAVIDLDVFALANAALYGLPTVGKQAVLIDAGPQRIVLTVLQHGVPVFARSLAHGLPSPELSLEAAATHLARHLHHTLYACENALQQSCEPETIVLSGVVPNQLSRVAAALEKETELRTEVWHLGSEHYKPGQVSLLLEEQTSYTIAFGTAIRGLSRQSVGLNLRRERFELHRDIQELRGRLIGLGVVLVLVAGLGLTSLYLSNRFKHQRYTQIQQQIAQIFRDTLPDTRMVQPTFQIREKVQEIEERLRGFGGVTGVQLSSLQILREISARVPEGMSMEVDMLTIATDITDLSGTTASYDNVVKLKDALEASPFFSTVKITNTKTDVANKIAFKLTISMAKTLGALS